MDWSVAACSQLCHMLPVSFLLLKLKNLHCSFNSESQASISLTVWLQLIWVH